MKSTILPLVILSGIITVSSCNQKDKEKEKSEENTTQTENSQEPKKTATSEPKTYTVAVIPEAATLGKTGQAEVKIKNVKAVELSNPDGEITGMELSYEVEVTNKSKIGGSSVYVNPSDFRLELDNGQKITHDNYNTITADPESTKSSNDNKFKLPPGTKPTALNLFFDETRVSVRLELK